LIGVGRAAMFMSRGAAGPQNEEATAMVFG